MKLVATIGHKCLSGNKLKFHADTGMEFFYFFLKVGGDFA